MSIENIPLLPTYTIDTVESSDKKGAISCAPERGGIITGIRLDGTNILYMDEQTFLDPTKNVRGGVPLLFPNAGPINDPAFPGLLSHGTARLSDKWQGQKKGEGKTGFVETLTSDGSDARYPYAYDHTIDTEIIDGACVITQQVYNKESERALPVAFGLHPYFKVPRDALNDVVFNFAGGDTVRAELAQWSTNQTTTLIKNPGVLRVTMPGVGELELEASLEYQVFAFWAMPDKDYICIEPMMRREGGLVNDPALVPPGESFSAWFSIKFTKAA